MTERSVVPAEFSTALRYLKDAQKSGPGVPAYTRWVNRPVGRVLAALAHRIGLQPDVVTMISGLVSLAAFVWLALAAPVSVSAAVGVTLLLLLAYGLDSADGQLARLRAQSSKAGEWLDHVVDSARLPLFHLAVGIALLRSDGLVWGTAIALAFAVLSSTWFFAQILGAQLSPEQPGRSGGGSPPWVSFAKLFSDIGTLYLLVLLIPWPLVFIVPYSLLFAFSVVMAGASLSRRYRSLRSLPAGA